MQRELSSKASFIYRIIAPAALIVGAAFLLGTLSGNFDFRSEKRFFVLFAVGTCVAMVIFALYLSSAKRIWLENDELIVVGFAEETRIPLKNVYRVTATRFWNPEQVRIYFRSQHGVDTSIYFYPPIRWFRLWSQHPIAEEIRRLAHDAALPGILYVEKSQPTNWSRVLLGVVGITLFSFVIIGMATEMMKRSEPYQWSLAHVQNNPSIVESLGSPIEAGWFVAGSISAGGGNGSAHLEYSVVGPYGKGSVLVVAKKTDNVWIYEYGEIEIEGEYISFLGNEDRTDNSLQQTFDSGLLALLNWRHFSGH